MTLEYRVMRRWRGIESSPTLVSGTCTERAIAEAYLAITTDIYADYDVVVWLESREISDWVRVPGTGQETTDGR